jgi:O-antigen/teichoic acid export membrane protein
MNMAAESTFDAPRAAHAPAERGAPTMTAPVGRSVLIYACAFTVAGATPFLLLPVLTRQLSPQQFGEVTSFLILAAMLANAAGLSAHGFVAVRYFKCDRSAFASLSSSAMAAVVAAHVLAAVLVGLLFPLLQRLLGLPLGWTLLAVLASLVLSLNLVLLSIFQSAGRPLHYLWARIVQGGIELLGCLALLVLLLPDAGARIWSYTAALIGSALFAWRACARAGLVGAPVRSVHLRALAVFGVPMLPHIVAGSALTYLDRVVVSSLLGAESLGLYMAAMQTGMVLVVLIEPLNKALGPWLFAQLARDDGVARRVIVWRTYLLWGGLVLAACGLAIVATSFFDSLVGERYVAAKGLVPWMAAGFVLQGMYYTVVNYLFYAERTGRLSVMSGITACVGCGVSYGLTSAYGLDGAAASFAINYALLFVLVWIAAARAVPMPWLRARPR